MARFGRALNRGGSQRGTDATSVEGRKAAGQQLVFSHGRSCGQRIALTLSLVGVFPMTHHVECVAILERASVEDRARPGVEDRTPSGG